MANEKVVVVGAGGIFGAWMPNIKREQLDLVAIVDLNLEAARRRVAENNLDCLASTDLADALRQTQPDFVIDLTVPAAHGQVTCTALRAGFPVIGEKPMAASMAEAREMVKAAEESGKLYMVSQSRRYEPRHRGLHAALASGRIGGLTTVNCDFYLGCHFGGFRDEMESPLILDMAIHQFDLARMMTGASPVAVYAREFNPRGSWYRGDVAASCIFEMSDGIVFTYRGSWCAEGMHTSWHGDWRLIGTKGSICYERDQVPHGEVVTGDSGFNRPREGFDVADVNEGGKGQHGALQEMLACLREGVPPQGECHDNIQSLAMVFGAIESSRKGRRVAIRA